MPLESAPRHAGSRASAGTWGRRTLWGSAALLMALVAWHVVGIQGLIVPVRVSESSMAPGLLGEHAVVRCPVCERRFPVELFDASGADLRTVCPRCGTLHRLTAPLAVRRGERVLINRWARYRPERLRWQTVAVRNPADARRIGWSSGSLVCPAKRLNLRHGDVYVDGTLQAKSLAEFRQLTVPVFDTLGTRPLTPVPAWTRWQPRSGTTPGDSSRHGYVSDRTDDGSWSWLAFQGCDLPGQPSFRGTARRRLSLQPIAFAAAVSRARSVVAVRTVQGFTRDKLPVACTVAARRPGGLGC